jgi:hypothetical protein
VSPEANVIEELNGAEEMRMPVLSAVVAMNSLLTGPNPEPDPVKIKIGLVAL